MGGGWVVYVHEERFEGWGRGGEVSELITNGVRMLQRKIRERKINIDFSYLFQNNYFQQNIYQN